MTIVQQILEILKYILPAIVVLIATYLVVEKFLFREIERKRLAIFQQNNIETLRMRMQAYERLSILAERMHPHSLISRYYTQQATAQDVQLAMVQGIRAEFEHNVSQQLYVSYEVWQTLRTAMEQEITMLNQIGSSMEMGAPSQHYIKKLSEFLVNAETTIPSDIALEAINREAKKLLIS